LALLSGQRFSVDYQYLLNYINRGHKTLNKNLDTFYSEVKKFPPGHVMEVSPTLHKKLRPFGLKNTPSITPPSSFEDAAQQTLEIITQSLRLRLRSDVSMGFCLSGGVDSTALASIATKLLNIRVNSYSIIDHDPRYNEQTNINAVVQDIQSNHHPVFLGSKSENESRLLKLIEQRSAPLGTISYLVHSFLSEQIHQDGHRIAISGTGSDEIFSGYYDHFCWHLATLDPNSPAHQEALNHWNRFVLPLVRNPEMKKPLLFVENPRYRDYILAPISIANQFLICPIASWFEETTYSYGGLRNR
jgi:asparagine synthase (glutamine-hydrolysing)